MSTITRIAIIVGTLGVAAPAIAAHPSVSTAVGTPVHTEAFDRQIQVGPRTKWANVTRDETIKFV